MSRSSPFSDLRKEHEILLTDVKALTSSVRQARAAPAEAADRLRTLGEQLDMFTRGLLLHFRREEEGLYPDAQQMISEGAERSDVFGQFFAEEGEDDLAAHVTLGSRAQEMRDVLQEMSDAAQPTDEQYRRLLTLAQLTAALVERHAAKEDTLIFPMIERALTADQVDMVGERLRRLQSSADLTDPDGELRGLGADQR